MAIDAIAIKRKPSLVTCTRLEENSPRRTIETVAVNRQLSLVTCTTLMIEAHHRKKN